jgi:hypothetical protein
MGVGICANCHEEKEIESRGMCNNCYRYWHRNKKARPVDDIAAMRRRTKHTHCVNCGELRKKKPHGRSIGARGMCHACYQFWYENGRMRTEADKIRSKNAKPGFCSNCKESRELFRGLCSACYHYKTRFGHNRPRRLFRNECSNCHVPLGDYRPHKGRCKRCQLYLQEFGKERPEHVWKAPFGWCDCSDGKHPSPATHVVTVWIGETGREDTLPMCADCYAEEMRQRSIYGDNRKGTGSDSGTQSRYSYSGDD